METNYDNDNIGKHSINDTFKYDEINYLEQELKNDEDYTIVFEDKERKLKMFTKNKGVSF